MSRRFLFWGLPGQPDDEGGNFGHRQAKIYFYVFQGASWHPWERGLLRVLHHSYPALLLDSCKPRRAVVQSASEYNTYHAGAMLARRRAKQRVHGWPVAV